MVAEKLTTLKVKNAKPGMHGDGKGLWLRVGGNGAKSWIFRFMLIGQAREMGLGSAADVTLAEARTLARETRKLKAEGKTRSRQSAPTAPSAGSSKPRS